MYSAKSSHLPLKINMAVLFPIFASSIICFLLTRSMVWTWKGMGSLGAVGVCTSEWPALTHLLFYRYPYFSAFIRRCYLTRETAENLKKSGAFIRVYDR